MLTNPFAVHSELFYSAFSAICLLELYFSIYVTARCVKSKKRLYAFFSAVCAVLQFLLFEGASNELLFYFLNSEFYLKRTVALFLDDIITVIPVIVAILTFTVSVFIFVFLIKNIKNKTGNNSIKEGIDLLPTGLCYYTPDGIPRLVNRTMNSLSFELTGNALMNGNTFSESVFSNPEATHLSDGGVVIKNSDGRYYSFSVSEISTELYKKLKYVLAIDITEQMALKTELEEKNRELTEINERIHFLSEKIVSTTIQKEILAHKTAIHNNLGELLIKTSAFLDNGNYDANELVSLWKENLTLFSISPSENETDRYELMKKTAEDVGIELIINGNLPQSIPCKNILASAMHQCMTNTICHAGGKKVFIDIEKSRNLVKVVFTNDGKPPAGEITEGTGLSEVRTLTEKAGGIMTVKTSPRFALELKIPV